MSSPGSCSRLAGLSLSLIWAGAELWINLGVDDAHRGRVLSLFTLVFWLGFLCGPSIISLVGFEGALPLLFGVAAMALALPFLYAMPRDTGTIANDGKRHTMLLPVWPALIVLATAAMAGMGDVRWPRCFQPSASIMVSASPRRSPC